MKIAVTGAGGFIGGHLVNQLLNDGHQVSAYDIKPLREWQQVRGDARNHPLVDVGMNNADFDFEDMDEVYQLAADMGGLGFIQNNKARCMLSVLASTNTLLKANEAGVGRFFYPSSACAYPAGVQTEIDSPPIKESDIYPAMPEDGYGWEKLFSERMCNHFYEDFGLETRVARYHNTYGPWGEWEGGRDKAPAAMCRKVAIAKLSKSHEVEVWGDGMQTRTFTYIDDCLKGTVMLTRSDVHEPVNLGSAELISINDLANLTALIAGVNIHIRHIPGALGVRGRCSDNTLINKLFDWEPSISLSEGMERTYEWVYNQVKAKYFS